MVRKMIMVVLLFAAACENKQIDEIEKDGVRVQLLKSEQKVDKSYKVRIFPEASPLANKAEMRNRMWYNMDSCFYLMAGGEKIYPAMQEPVSSGISGCFEYLLLFEGKIEPSKDVVFTYDDKHINNRSYTFKLN